MLLIFFCVGKWNSYQYTDKKNCDLNESNENFRKLYLE